MATPKTSDSAPAMSQKQRRALLKKERRKRKRQALALARQRGEQDDGIHTPEEEEDYDDEEGRERQRLHDEWLQRERCAQEEFRLLSEREEAARRRKEEEERHIKDEWEAQQKKEQEAKEHKLQERRDREEAVQKMLDQAESQLDSKGPWMNPEAPASVNSDNYGTERDVANCPFFLKTGACRFGERCSRKHVHPMASPTLLIRGMFVTFGMDQVHRDDYDTDACLEHSEEELHEHFLEFYHDVLPEFRSIGKVLQFKVSCNFEPHLRGNVYIQFETEEQCMEAFVKFNGRWYAGKQLHCELSPVTRWKNAICGLYDRQKCPKGKHCNFLHVFRNPGNEFWEADRDLHLSPDRDGTHRGGRYSERYGQRSWRRRPSSRSPQRADRPHSRREWRRSRSRSRESRASDHHGGDSTRSDRTRPDCRKDTGRHRERDRRRSRSRSRGRERDRSKSRSRVRERDRSKSRGRERDRSKSRGRERDRSKSRSRVRERDRSKSRGRERDRSKSRSRGRERDRSKSRSRERDRSKSKGRERDRSKSRSRGTERDRSKSRSRGTERDRSKSRGRERDRPVDRNGDSDTVVGIEGERGGSQSMSRNGLGHQSTGDRAGNHSPPAADKREDTHVTRHRKHSRKGKKHKRKHKKKSLLPQKSISSAESDEAYGLGVEQGEKALSAVIPSQEQDTAGLDRCVPDELGLNAGVDTL